MTDALRILNNAQAREATLETLEEMLEKLTLIAEEHSEDETSAQKEQAKHQAKFAAIRAKLLEDGIDPYELLGSASATKSAKSKREHRPAKYKYVDENGNEKLWAGQGRAPKAIAAAIKSGKKLEEFEI